MTTKTKTKKNGAEINPELNAVLDSIKRFQDRTTGSVVSVEEAMELVDRSTAFGEMIYQTLRCATEIERTTDIKIVPYKRKSDGGITIYVVKGGQKFWAHQARKILEEALQ